MVIDEVERGMIGFSFSLRDTRGRGTEEGEGVVCEEEEEEDEEAEVVEVEAMEREGKEDPEAGEVVQESDSTGRKKDRRVFCFITRRSEKKSPPKNLLLYFGEFFLHYDFLIPRKFRYSPSLRIKGDPVQFIPPGPDCFTIKLPSDSSRFFAIFGLPCVFFFLLLASCFLLLSLFFSGVIPHPLHYYGLFFSCLLFLIF